MKTLITSLFVCFIISHNILANVTILIENTSQEETVNKNIQSRIFDAFMSSFVDQNNSKITSLIKELSSSFNKSDNDLFLYWKGYALYYDCIISLKNGDREKAHSILNDAVETLESIERKNSEDYALLSMLQSFSCQFLGFPAVIKVSKDATANIQRAIELDENNIRAYYVLANNDYYTPENYGGGKDVEKYALKAISLPSQAIVNPFLPSWGRQEAYELLTNHYLKSEKFDKAKKYIDLGLKEYPNSYVLKSNKAKIPY